MRAGLIVGRGTWADRAELIDDVEVLGEEVVVLGLFEDEEDEETGGCAM